MMNIDKRAYWKCAWKLQHKMQREQWLNKGRPLRKVWQKFRWEFFYTEFFQQTLRIQQCVKRYYYVQKLSSLIVVIWSANNLLVDNELAWQGIIILNKYWNRSERNKCWKLRIAAAVCHRNSFFFEFSLSKWLLTTEKSCKIFFFKLKKSSVFWNIYLKNHYYGLWLTELIDVI